jgi:hypothetical protein
MSEAAAAYQETPSKYEPRRSSSTIPPEAIPAVNATSTISEPAAKIKQEVNDQVQVSHHEDTAKVHVLIN